MITSIKHITIPVKDQERAIKFYTEKMGFEITTDVDFGLPQRWVELALPESDVKVVLFTPEGHENRIGTESNILFSTETIQETYDALKERGVEMTHDVTHESWGSYFGMKDSEGNAFIISKTDD
ncbi:MAG: hypothetical protein S4CHLAM102_09700 [Chlamydiia bacterium]|nr:hypothetical protein [Chlamydiia bacterium]